MTIPANQESPVKTRGAAPSQRRIKILIIDDAPEVLRLVDAYLLMQWPNAKISTAETARRAIDLIQSSEFDLTILDLGLPDGDGMDLLPRIKKFSRAPIIIMSGKNDSATRITGLRMGADDFIGKPVRVEEVVARVEAILRRANKSVLPSPRYLLPHVLIIGAILAIVIVIAIKFAVENDGADPGAVVETASEEMTEIIAQAIQVAPNFPNFADAFGITLRGGSYIDREILVLTEAQPEELGAAWSKSKVNVADGFSTTFVARVSEQTNGGADGFAFVIQNDSALALGLRPGPSLGYEGIKRSVAVEFDTWFSSGFADPRNNHVAVHTKGIESNSPDNAFALGSSTDLPDFDDGAPHTFRIAYDGGKIEVFIDDALAPQLSVSLDLRAHLELMDGAAWVGFTASTGGASARHEILSWTFEVE